MVSKMQFALSLCRPNPSKRRRRTLRARSTFQPFAINGLPVEIIINIIMSFFFERALGSCDWFVTLGTASHFVLELSKFRCLSRYMNNLVRDQYLLLLRRGDIVDPNGRLGTVSVALDLQWLKALTRQITDRQGDTDACIFVCAVAKLVMYPRWTTDCLNYRSLLHAKKERRNETSLKRETWLLGQLMNQASVDTVELRNAETSKRDAQDNLRCCYTLSPAVLEDMTMVISEHFKPSRLILHGVSVDLLKMCPSAFLAFLQYLPAVKKLHLCATCLIGPGVSCSQERGRLCKSDHLAGEREKEAWTKVFEAAFNVEELHLSLDVDWIIRPYGHQTVVGALIYMQTMRLRPYCSWVLARMFLTKPTEPGERDDTVTFPKLRVLNIDNICVDGPAFVQFVSRHTTIQALHVGGRALAFERIPFGHGAFKYSGWLKVFSSLLGNEPLKESGCCPGLRLVTLDEISFKYNIPPGVISSPGVVPTRNGEPRAQQILTRPT